MQYLRDVDLNLLVLLDALLREESVTRAAERVSMSPPAMSRALGRLREQLGDPLLVRAGRELVPTPRARELAPEVRSLVEAVERVMRPQESPALASLERRFRIRATDHVLAVLGPGVDRAVAEQAPGVALDYSPNLPSDPDDLREGRVDLAIGVYHRAAPELRRTTLFHDRFVCVVRADHPRVKRKPSLERFAAMEHVLVAPRFQPGSVVDHALAERGLERRVARVVPYFLAALHLVAGSDYVLTVSERLARAEAERFGLRVVGSPLPLERYPIHALWHPRLDADGAHRWLRQVLVDAAAGLSAP